MSDNNQLIRQALTYIKAHKIELIEKFANDSIFPSEEVPISVFMAGSPGAGKTEFSKRLIERFGKKSSKKIVRIDADEIREMLPGYNGRNSFIFQGAVSVGVEKLHDNALDKKQSFILDGTFANYEKSYQNVQRSLKRGRPTSIVYLYQDPFIAWSFTKKREKLEGRYIPKEIFIKELFIAKENVNKIKAIFGEKINILLVENNFTNGLIKVKLNIKNIDSHLSIKYTESELKKGLS